MLKNTVSALCLFALLATLGAVAQAEEPYGCIGVAVENQQGIIFVKEDLPNSPALQAGLAAGDVIESVQPSSDSGMIPVTGKTLEEVVKLIRGPVGSPVSIVVLRDGQSLAFTMTREIIPHD